MSAKQKTYLSQKKIEKKMAIKVVDRPIGFGYDDPALGWYVFPKEQNVEVAYGDKLRLKWHAEDRAKIIDISIDGGNKWCSSQSINNVYHALGLRYGGYQEHVFKPIVEALLRFKAERQAKIDAMTPEELVQFKREERQRRSLEIKALKEEAGVRATQELIELGPKLVKIKDKVDTIFKLVENGNIKKPISRFSRKLEGIHAAEYMLNELITHLRNQQPKR